jgi:hypothetical protein
MKRKVEEHQRRFISVSEMCKLLLSYKAGDVKLIGISNLYSFICQAPSDWC